MIQVTRNDIGAGRGMRTQRNAFTLIEILIVIVILGILASIVIPQFTGAAQTARENSLKDDLRFLRMQFGVFMAQHRDIPPGYPGGDRSATPTEADFVDQMTLHTDEHCNTNAAATSVYKYGPYLSRVPQNPLNQLDSVMVIPNGGAIPAPDDSTGWIYKPQTQEIVANSPGVDATGIPYADY